LPNKTTDCECDHDREGRRIDVGWTESEEEIGRSGDVEGCEEGVDSGGGGEEDGEDAGGETGCGGGDGAFVGVEIFD